MSYLFLDTGYGIMDSTIITAIAAACGSLVGAAATIVTTWITQRTQTTNAEREQKLRNREALYGEFIMEASRLTMDGLSHSLEKPETFVILYGILGRIRLVAAEPVLGAAEVCCRQIVDLYAKPNMTVEQIRAAFERDRLDPMRDFSVVCRRELLEIGRGDGSSGVGESPCGGSRPRIGLPKPEVPLRSRRANSRPRRGCI